MRTTRTPEIVAPNDVVTVMAMPDRVAAGAARRGVVVAAGLAVGWAPVAGGGAPVAAGFAGDGAAGAGAGAGFCGDGAGVWACTPATITPDRTKLNSTLRIGLIIVRSTGIIPDGRQGYPEETVARGFYRAGIERNPWNLIRLKPA